VIGHPPNITGALQLAVKLVFVIDETIGLVKFAGGMHA